MPFHSFTNREVPTLAFAVINSNITAIAAEMAAARHPDATFMAISRRGCKTTLPLAGDGEQLELQFRPKGILQGFQCIRTFDAYFSNLAEGKPFDVLICHSSDPLSQLLITHPLCRKFFYIEEGLTASVGKRMGRPHNGFTVLKRSLWRVKSHLFYQGRIAKYSPYFYDTRKAKYGGVYALSPSAFIGFPGRIQLDFRNLPATGEALKADLMILLDSQYFIGACHYEEYKQALLACVRNMAADGDIIALKFHPAEKTIERKMDLKTALLSIPGIASLHELPGEFIAERMPYSKDVTVIVGTTALGLYMGNRGFRTVTFARRLAPFSEKIAAFINDIPEPFFAVCEEG